MGDVDASNMTNGSNTETISNDFRAASAPPREKFSLPVSALTVVSQNLAPVASEKLGTHPFMTSPC